MMTHDEIESAIERLERHSTEDNSADAVICRLMDSSGWLVPDFRYALISLLRQADPYTHAELPKDCNGETVRIGDKVEHLYSGRWDEPNGRWGEPFEIVELRLRPSGWTARGENGAAVITEACRRYKKPTIEDVLREFGDEVQRCCDTEDTIAEYAAKLREVMAYE